MMVVGATVVHRVFCLDLHRGEASTRCGQRVDISRGLLNGNELSEQQQDRLWDRGQQVVPCMKCCLNFDDES